MQLLIMSLHVLVAILIIGLVLIQKGKGASLGAGFGTGASNTVFGSQGATPFLVKLIASLAIIFFMTSLSLGYMARHNVSSQEALENFLKEDSNVDKIVANSSNVEQPKMTKKEPAPLAKSQEKKDTSKVISNKKR